MVISELNKMHVQPFQVVEVAVDIRDRPHKGQCPRSFDTGAVFGYCDSFQASLFRGMTSLEDLHLNYVSLVNKPWLRFRRYFDEPNKPLAWEFQGDSAFTSMLCLLPRLRFVFFFCIFF